MVFYYFLLSIIAVVLVFAMVLIEPITNIITFWEKLFVVVVAITSCLFGISLTIHPNWWRTFSRYTKHISKVEKEKTKLSFIGHHPDCGTFKRHVIVIKNKPRCAGCFGLALGFIVSIILLVIYLFLSLGISIVIYYILLVFGFFLLFIVYWETMFNKRYTLLHIIINILFVLSFLMITLSVLGITNNPVYGILTILICFLWLDTRIHLSKQQHKNICASCPKSCKMY